MLLLGDLAIASNTHVVVFTDVNGVTATTALDGKVLWSLSQPDVHALDMSPSGRLVFASEGEEEERSRLFVGDVTEGEFTVLARFEYTAQCAAWSSDATSIAIGTPVGDTLVFDADTGEELLRYTAHVGGIRCLRYTPSGKTLVTGGEDGKICFSDSVTGAVRGSIELETAVAAIDISEDGTLLVASGEDGVVRIWNPR